MTDLLARFRTANRATRRATALAAVLVVALGFAVTRVSLPLPVRVFAEAGQAVVAHPDGKRVAVANEHTVSIVDTTTGAVTATVALGGVTLCSAAGMAPGTSRALFVGTYAENAVLAAVDVDAATVTSVTVLKDGPEDASKATSIAVDRSGAVFLGSKVAAGVDGRVWRSGSTGIDGVAGSGSAYEIYDRLALSPDGRLLFATGTSRALVVDTATGRIDKDIRRADLVAVTDPMVRLAADGEHVFTAGSGSRQVTVRALTGEPVRTVEAGARVNDIALSLDGATLYAILSDRLLAIDVSRYT